MAGMKKKKGSAEVGSLAAARRNWSELPDLPLRSVLDRLFSIPDAFAFAGVCLSWRSVAKSTASEKARASYPPMILRPVPVPVRRGGRLRFRLDTLNDPYTSYRCMLSSATVSGFCIGNSFGNLVVLVGRRPRISNVFSGDEILAPNLPDDGQKYDKGFLTAPPSSPDCGLFLSGFNSKHLLFWKVGTDEWSKHPQDYPLFVPLIQQVLLFEGRPYALDFVGRVLTIQFSPQLSVRPLEGLPLLRPSSIFQQLVQCGDELLAVCFDKQCPEVFHIKIHVFRLDFSRKAWVEVEDLGDWSLFIYADAADGRYPVSCIRPARWGGRNNCFYILGPGCDSWKVFPFDGKLFDLLSMASPYYPAHRVLPSWPSPIWVYPSEFY